MQPPGPVAVVPLRAPGDGKTRLAAQLSSPARARLATAMLEDVVAAITGAGVATVVVAANGRTAVAAARRLGVAVVEDAVPSPGLDGAIAAVTRRHPGCDVLVVQADLAWLTPADVAAVVAAPGDVVVAPSADGGTAALLRRPGDVMATHFGPASARRHLEAARAAGLVVGTVRRPGLAVDLDTPSDLERARRRRPGAATSTALAALPLVRPDE